MWSIYPGYDLAAAESMYPGYDLAAIESMYPGYDLAATESMYPGYDLAAVERKILAAFYYQTKCILSVNYSPEEGSL